jgi:hypothetical protein
MHTRFVCARRSLKNTRVKIEDVMSIVINSIQNFLWMLYNKTLLICYRECSSGVFRNFILIRIKSSACILVLVIILENVKYNAEEIPCGQY